MTEPVPYSYIGGELVLFIEATNWKSYWPSRVRPFVRGNVLDGGAGLGATFDYLAESAEHVPGTRSGPVRSSARGSNINHGRRA